MESAGRDLLFSVIIPACNSSRWIEEALASVLAQGRSDLETIVVDDGSTDDTAARVARVPGVRLIRQENQGPASARNRGIGASAGKWVAFLDADDRWRPGHLDRLEDAIRLRPDAGLVFSAAMVIDEDGREQKPKDSPPLGADPFHSLLLRNTITTSCVAVRRDALERAGGFSPSFRGPEDWDLWLRLARLYPVIRVPLITADYRRQEAGLVHTAGNRLREQNLVIITRAGSLEPGLPDAVLARARANCYFESAVRHLSAGDAAGARAELVRSLRERPASLKSWALLVVSLGGRMGARALKRAWRRGEGQGGAPLPPDDRPLRVDFFITDSGTGGAEKMLSAIIRGLDPDRYHPRLIVMKPPGKTAESLRQSGVTVVGLGLPAGLGPGYALGLPAAAFRLFRVLRQDPPDVLHCWLFQANLLGRLVGRIAGVRAVISSLRVMESERQLQFPLDRLTRGLVSRYVAVSTSTALLYAERLRLDPGRLAVVPNGVAEPSAGIDRDSARGALGLGPDDRAALFLGRLHRQKGLDVLLAGLPAASDRIPGLRLLVAGDGPERDRLMAQARSLGVEFKVRFLGETDPAPLLSAADCLVLPSRWEGMPNAVLEAMAVGLPVIASSVGAVPEILPVSSTDDGRTGEAGMIVPPADPTALAQALVAVLNDPARARAMGRAGSERVRERHSLRQMVAEYDQLYRKLSGVP